MRDYTTNNHCDFLWINDLLALEKNHKNGFSATITKNDFSKTITVSNVIIFGTIVEVKQVGARGFLYQVDDGTGVIACKHNEEQFEELICMIENEQCDISNQTLISKGLEQSDFADTSAEDSIFNDKSLQKIEVDINNKNQLLAMQSLWEDIYNSFSCLIQHYTLGDVVLIEGKLYNYFHVNQVYVNSIRPLSLAEELVRVSMKLEDGYAPLPRVKEPETDKRLSGLMTFDHIHHLNPRFPSCRNIQAPEPHVEVLKEESEEVVPPNLNSTITFDTLNQKI